MSRGDYDDDVDNDNIDQNNNNNDNNNSIIINNNKSIIPSHKTDFHIEQSQYFWKTLYRGGDKSRTVK